MKNMRLEHNLISQQIQPRFFWAAFLAKMTTAFIGIENIEKKVISFISPLI